MAYHFYGWETADVEPVNDLYPLIHNPRDLYDALCGIWSAQSCAPRLRCGWTPQNKTYGQCSITAFLAQDIFGGGVYGVPLPDGSVHCYNVSYGRRFDLTSEQFGEKAGELVYRDELEQSREAHFADPDKRRRYEMLRAALAEAQKR